jgi:hypothetical protein
MDLATLFERALADRGGHVHGVWEPLHRVVRPIARWVLRDEAPALSLADKLRSLPAQHASAA